MVVLEGCGGFYAIGLIIKSLKIMKKMSIETGNDQALRDFNTILTITILMSLAIGIRVICYILLATLLSFNVYPFGADLD